MRSINKYRTYKVPMLPVRYGTVLRWFFCPQFVSASPNCPKTILERFSVVIFRTWNVWVSNTWRRCGGSRRRVGDSSEPSISPSFLTRRSAAWTAWPSLFTPSTSRFAHTQCFGHESAHFFIPKIGNLHVKKTNVFFLMKKITARYR